ncbi:zinc carboxypeptidase [Hahella sp. KA22]|uniref:M14 family metallopeptidase n=1 Tax=Hahella sp. KA22 TaxID=1628392 RepID=UPI000FDE66B5|nr:M14 family metallopeptidase [Hahella sp. KA22]AZZ89842.1 zinc carboxypeptidase [Hahella sp. KA22]QAY53211.1 zinc carboxypeptidase [Hahella sp. KA22]
MKLVRWLALICTILPGVALAGQLSMARITLNSGDELKSAKKLGLDIVHYHKLKNLTAGVKGESFTVEAVLSPIDKEKLDKAGIKWEPMQMTSQFRSAFSASGETAYHSFDEPELGIEDRLYALAEKYPALVTLYKIGESHQGRPLIVAKLSRKTWWERWFDRGGDLKDGYGVSHQPPGRKKPEVFYVATHHAREWVATQMAMRYMDYLTENYGKIERITKLLNHNELWIMPVANPDGYEYTFTNERLWRKNLRDNDGDGQITLQDGVDLNRNFGEHWGLDDEGSSPVMSDQTYRGPSAGSEPETVALTSFIQAHDFRFTLSYHTYSNLILYPFGWQVQTPSFDNPIFVAQAGTDDNPAIYDSIIEAGYDPGVSADLYTTNGDFTDWSYGALGIPSYTVELTSGQDKEGNSYGFEFPDDEKMLQAVFNDNLEFALTIAESARRPDSPVSAVGIETEDVYHEPLTTSWGATQSVDMLAKRRIGDRSFLVYQVDGGSPQLTRFRRKFGDRYNTEQGTYFNRYEAKIRGQAAGSTVTYWIKTVKGEEFGPYSYTVEKASGAKVLVVAAEDYTGEYPVYENNTAPNYLSFYTDALDGAGYSYDVWDVDARGAVPPAREVMSHYDAVIWYTGDDFVSTVLEGFQAHEQMKLQAREYINYWDGKVMATGQGLSEASTVYAQFNDDFFQYYMGAFLHLETSGLGKDGNALDVVGQDDDPIMAGLRFSLNGGDSANNQHTPDSFLVTSSFVDEYHQTLAATYDRPGGGFNPTSGTHYVYSQQADQSFKRLGGTIEVPADAPYITFNMAHETEADWDFVFVEIAEQGSDNWTTLPEANGLTSQDTGESCKSGWVDLHPTLAHYMDASCNPTGTTGQWNAMSGSSAGFRTMLFDLSAYAGKTVEIYISYASDWGTQGLGVFVDDVKVGENDAEDFEDGFGLWQPGAPDGAFNINNWDNIEGAGFVDGPVIRDEDTIYMGFGLEGVDGYENRVKLIERSMSYFGL